MPDWKNEIRKHLADLKLSPVREVEIVEELSQDLEDRYQRLLLHGSTEQAARTTVLNELQENEIWTKELRRVERSTNQNPISAGEPSRSNLVGDLFQDLRYALRILIKNPSFTAVAVIALALAIGANTAIFCDVNSVLLCPLPYKNPDQLMLVWEDASRHGYPRDTPAAANYVDWRDQNQTFEGMAAMNVRSFNLTGVGDPEKIEGRRVSASLFPLLGVEPQLGRVFTASEDQPGSNQVVILSHILWQRRFGGDDKIVGKSLTLNNASYTVVGVMPANFQFPTREDELWVPIAFASREAGNRNKHYLEVLGRLKP